MSSKFSDITAKWEPVFSKFRVPLVAGTAMVVLAGTVIVSGGNPATPTTVTTSGDELGAGQAAAAPADPGAPIDPATAAAGGAKAAAAPKTVVKKGGLTITTTAGGVPEANLFTAAENLIGITNTAGKFGKGQITICGHAATTFGPAFNTSPEDLNVYWQALDDIGGVHSRNVLTSWENDNYDPATAVTAATACKAKNPFILLGGIGFEQIPTVRSYVEDNHMLYIHHIAISDLSKKYSFAPLPTVQTVGKLAGEWVRKKFPNLDVGIIYRDSPYWIPGMEEFEKALGKKAVAKQPVIKNQGSYQVQILDMQTKGADLVFAWENALAQAAMINEADSFVPPYRPQWIVFPFNLVTDTLGDRALNPTLHGIATWSAYTPGGVSGRLDNGKDPYAEYAAEIAKFEAAYKKYRDVPLTDIHWMTWLAWKSIHYTLDQCGRDCNRNKVVGVMISKPYDYSLTAPSCATDFTRNGHEGGYWASMFEAYRRANGSVGFKHIQHCKDAWS